MDQHNDVVSNSAPQVAWLWWKALQYFLSNGAIFSLLLLKCLDSAFLAPLVPLDRDQISTLRGDKSCFIGWGECHSGGICEDVRAPPLASWWESNLDQSSQTPYTAQRIRYISALPEHKAVGHQFVEECVVLHLSQDSVQFKMSETIAKKKSQIDYITERGELFL